MTLTCTAELSGGAEVNVPVTVTFVLSRTDPAGSPLTTVTPSMSGSTYTSTAMVSSFGRNQSGVYTCTATVSSTSSFVSSNMGSMSARVTVGKTSGLSSVHVHM